MLQNYSIPLPFKLSALWGSLSMCYIYCDYFELYVPGKTEGLVSGDNLLNSPTNLFLAALLLTVPALMIAGSLLLPPRWNRLTNIILGVFYTALMLLIASGSLEPWRYFYLMMALVESALSAVISWLAWNWPRTSA